MSEDKTMSEHELINRLTAKKQNGDKATPLPNTDVNTPDVVSLQGVIGNQGVQRMLKQGKGTLVQTKLMVGPANDQYEQEADQVAKEVVHNQPSDVQRAEEDELQMKRIQRAEEDELALKRIQRAEEDEEMQLKRIQRAEEDELQMKPIQRAEEDELALKRIQRAEEDELQMKRVQREEAPEEEMMLKRIQRTGGDAGFEVGGDIESSIQSKKGSGQPLSDNVRSQMESGFGADFGNVRVHADAESDTLNQSLEARAFTHGSDVFFRQGEYNPDNTAGQELLAHELTHVVQQGAAQPKREDQA
jgi:hypothetical protein